MCGIIGYIGKNKVTDKLLNGLKKLEYRGYDSSGIALKNKDEIEIIKSVGKIANLEEKIKNTRLIDADMGIAHTRWATKGEPNETNAHPHKSGRITLVHNGIIENAKEIKDKLKAKGIDFYSTTDTEVIATLINYYYEDNLLEAIEKSMSKLKGSYALGIIASDDDKLYAVCKDSPLVVGLGISENYISSDINAIKEFCPKYMILDERDIAVITSNEVHIYNNGKEKNKKIYEIDKKNRINGKDGYEHYMLKEIMEEPKLLREFFTRYGDLKNIPDISSYEEVHIVACGSAMYAGLIGKSLLEEKAHIKTMCECASEYRYSNIIYDKNTLVILISQSGETADTIAAMRNAKAKNINTLAIVNVELSTIARETDKQIFINAGEEVAVATTKAYLLQVASLILLSLKASIKKGLSENIDLTKVPSLIEDILKDRELYKDIAKSIYQNEDIFFIGRKIDYAMCLEGSLKLKEVSYIHSEAYPAGELKHGTISLIEKGTPVFAIVTDESIRDKTISNIEEVHARGANVYIITNKKIDFDAKTILIPKIDDFLEPLLVAPIMQLIAYETAYLRGCDIDKPKNLAKSVTVE